MSLIDSLTENVASAYDVYGALLILALVALDWAASAAAALASRLRGGDHQ